MSHFIGAPWSPLCMLCHNVYNIMLLDDADYCILQFDITTQISRIMCAQVLYLDLRHGHPLPKGSIVQSSAKVSDTGPTINVIGFIIGCTFQL